MHEWKQGDENKIQSNSHDTSSHALNDRRHDPKLGKSDIIIKSDSQNHLQYPAALPNPLQSAPAVPLPPQLWTSHSQNKTPPHQQSCQHQQARHHRTPDSDRAVRPTSPTNYYTRHEWCLRLRRRLGAGHRFRWRRIR